MQRNGIELVGITVHRALAYLGLLNRENYRPTANEVEAFAYSAGPRQPVYQGVLGRAISNFFDMFPQGELVQPGEPVVGYLDRMGWIGENAGRLTLTDCGRAILAAINRRVEENAELAEVVLDPEDPLVYVEFDSRFADTGPAMLADPYFKASQLPWLVERTAIDRVLVKDSPQTQSELRRLQVALATVLSDPDRVEIRTTSSNQLHDRCLIIDTGTVLTIGTSLSGVGKVPTVVSSIGDIAADAYRSKYQELWSQGSALKPNFEIDMTRTSGAIGRPGCP